MIEALNAITASSVQGATQAAVSVRSDQQQSEPVAPPQAPFISPRIRVDVELDRTILEIRDSDTGEVVDTFVPTEQQLAAFARAEASDNAVQEPAVQNAEVSDAAVTQAPVAQNQAAEPVQSTPAQPIESTTQSLLV